MSALGCVHRRIRKELEDLKKDPTNFYSAGPLGDDPLKWTGIIFGPSDSMYEGGIFHISIIFPITYPYKPPEIRFETKIYHPKINSSGAVGLSILNDKWAPNFCVASVLLTIWSMLNDPNPNDPMDSTIADMLQNNKEEFEQIARKWTIQYAL